MERTRSRQEISPLLQGASGVVLLLAMLLGVVGTIYKFVQPGGWLTTFATQGLPGGLTAFAALVAICALALVVPERHAPWRKNFLIYGFACVGGYYLLQLATRGTF